MLRAARAGGAAEPRRALTELVGTPGLGELGGCRVAQTNLLWKNALVIYSGLPFCGAENPPNP